MQPLTVITGILLGTSTAIAVGLAAVLLIFFLLADEYGRLQAEFRPLLLSTTIFICMTAICAMSFLGLVRQARWRWPMQAAMWIALAGVVLYYLPD